MIEFAPWEPLQLRWMAHAVVSNTRKIMGFLQYGLFIKKKPVPPALGSHKMHIQYFGDFPARALKINAAIFPFYHGVIRRFQISHFAKEFESNSESCKIAV